MDDDLIRAIVSGKTFQVKKMLAQGADVNATGADGETPLHVAAAGGNKGIVEALLAAGGDANAQDGEGETPLHLAVQEGDKRIVAALLGRGADVNAKNNAGWPPLYIAALHRNQTIAAALVANGAEISAKKGSAVLRWLQELKIVDDRSAPRNTSPQSATDRLGRAPTESFVIDVDMSSSKDAKER